MIVVIEQVVFEDGFPEAVERWNADWQGRQLLPISVDAVADN
jgi:hypothetical protein